MTNPFSMQPSMNEEDLQEGLEIWQNGRELRTIYNTPAWEILCNAVDSYAAKANQDLMRLPVGDPTVLTAHAAASAAEQIARMFKEDVANAVNQSFETPEIVKQMAKIGASE
jgi:hypothetical protein